MKRLIFAGISLLAIPLWGAETRDVNKVDHVLLITIDDLNDWIGCLTDRDAPADAGHLTGEGHPQASTPNMDRLAGRGVLFANAHCQAPICRPSRTSFMSGLRPTTSGIYANRPQHDAQGTLKPAGRCPG